MKHFVKFCLPLAVLVSSTLAQADWLDRSHKIFLPPGMSEQLGATQNYPILWWNFLVIEHAANRVDQVRALCRSIKSAPDSPIEKIPCAADLSSFAPLLQDWSRDYPLRHSWMGDSQFSESLATTLSQASLPTLGGSPKELMLMLRQDPFGSYLELKSILESQLSLALENQSGVFIDRATDRAVIPIQFKQAPSLTLGTGRFYDLVKTLCPKASAPNAPSTNGASGEQMDCSTITLIGPHASTYANEQQVQSDVERVSWIGSILTLIQFALLFIYRRARALLLFPPVLLATAIAAAVTVAIFGSIHGLTLAFGTGLIGLAIDYGLHSIFNMGFKGVWRANLCGIITTFVGFAVMSASEIPLLRQLMTFALVGLVCAYLFFQFLHTRYGGTFAVKPFEFIPRVSRLRTWGVMGILAVAIPFILILRPNLEMSQFDFQNPHSALVRNWIYGHMGVKASLLEVTPYPRWGDALSAAHTKHDWAVAHGIPLQSIALYLPTTSQLESNRATWTDAFCNVKKKPLARLTQEEQQFFAPALARFNCDSFRALGTAQESPLYIADLTSRSPNEPGFLNLWLPKDDAQTQAIHAAFPHALSLRDAVEVFPKTLSRELKWMSPLSVLLVTFFLFLYYRSVGPTALALVPFFCGAGVYALSVFAFQWSFSFISLIALLMVFGFSIDYGVFAVDVTLHPEGRSVTGVWTCLLFASLATALGFVPLLLCKHPVLAHLGQALTAGTIGTAIGTLWGIPGIYALTSPLRRSTNA